MIKPGDRVMCLYDEVFTTAPEPGFTANTWYIVSGTDGYTIFIKEDNSGHPNGWGRERFITEKEYHDKEFDKKLEVMVNE